MEETILLWVQEEVRNPVLDEIMLFITHLGDAGWIWIVTTIVLLILTKTRKTGAGMGLALVFSLLINNVFLKNVVARIRPYEQIEELVSLAGRQVDYSFPSGHTASSFAAATVLYLNLPKKYGIPALILAGLISISRIYVGVHYPTDVLAGAVSGIVCGLLAQWVIDKFTQRWKIFENKKKILK